MALDTQVVNEKVGGAMKPPLYRSPVMLKRASSSSSSGTLNKSDEVQETLLHRSSSLDTRGLLNRNSSAPNDEKTGAAGKSLSSSTSTEEINRKISNLESRGSRPPAPPVSPPKLWIRPTPSVSWSHKFCKNMVGFCVPVETAETWDRLFSEGLNVDVSIVTEDGGITVAHSFVLAAASPVLKQILLDQIPGKQHRRKLVNVMGVPYDAVRVFTRFLYSSRYEKDEMEKYFMHLIVLSHVYSVPVLKKVCTQELERSLLTTENVIDVLQLARLCDVPRLNILCLKLITENFKTVAKSEGWRVMRESDQSLEQELVGHVIETDAKKQERLRKLEDDRVYKQLQDTMQALVHISRDGCRTIGPQDGGRPGLSGRVCNYPACKGLESLVRHFKLCIPKVSGGCFQCKRMWDILELHSRMCSFEGDSCKVPLCKHFKERIGKQTKREEAKWKLLVSKVKVARGASTGFSLAAISQTLEQQV